MKGRQRTVASLAASLAVLGALALPALPSFAAQNPPVFSAQHRVGFQSGDDWEPAIAADRYGHEYVLYKHYDVTGGGTCPGCDLHLLVQRSSDAGRHWTAPTPIAPGVVDGGQYDSQIAVDPINGRTVWAAFLQNSNSVIAVVSSQDFGQTWTAPVIVSDPLPPGLDKPALVVRGSTVAVAYTDAAGNTFASVSQDGGTTWAVHRIFPRSDEFDFSLTAGGGIDSHGTLFFSWDSFDVAHSTYGDGPASLWVTRSQDGGATWTRTVIDVSAEAPPCPNCGYAFYSAQMALRVGSDDTVYLLWNGSVDQTAGAPARIFFSRSLNGGATYAPRREVSTAPAGVEHAFPAITTGRERGDVRIAWMDTRTGSWNVFYRESQSRGRGFSDTVRVSGPKPGYPYLTANGFGSPYGDYFQMTVDRQNRTQMAFGEGPSYQGPGNIWVAHQLADQEGQSGDASGDNASGDNTNATRASSATAPSSRTSRGLTSSSVRPFRAAEK